ncbi:protease [Verrucomicrobiota bacterium]|nr:protease [Verrucomicrobiota bacterium]
MRPSHLGTSISHRVLLTFATSLLALLALAAPIVVSAATTKPAPEPDLRRDAVVAAIEQVLPAVVNIGTETIVETRDAFDDLLREFWGPYYRRRPPDRQYSLGSGVIIDEDGYVLTNLHVVRRASRVWVKLADGRELEAQPVKGKMTADVALLKIVAKNGEKFKPVKFATDDDLLLGETVIALGNPFGLGGSVSRGILSSKERRAPRDGEALDVSNWLQTDAAINPGNSGGPLVNLRGELIGINVAVYREAQGIGFAIPIKRVNEALSEFFTPEAMRALWFGARVKSGGGPLIIQQVQDGSPAQRAGLRTNEVILQVNGHAPKNLIEFNRELTANADRKDVTLVVQRGYDRRTVTVRLLQERDFFNAALIRQKTGITLQEMTAEIAAQYGLRTASGFVITAVEKGSPAALAELQPYFLVQGIDGLVPPNLVEAAKLLHAKKTDATVRLDLIVPWRRGNLTGYREGAIELKVR